MAKRKTAARQPEKLQTLKAWAWSPLDERPAMQRIWLKKKAGGVLDDDEVSAVWRILERGHFVLADLAGNETKETDNG